jgi:hypothetical protein
VTQTAADIAALQLLNAGLGPIQVIKVIKENRMTENAPEDFTGQDDAGWGDATAKAAPTATYPEYPYKLADHVYTWSPKLPDGSMLVIRAQSADGLLKAVEDALPVVQRMMTAWRAATGAPQAPAPAPQGQFQAAAQQQFNQQPAQPFPNQPFQGQPAWQQAGAPQGAQVPQGWYKLTVPFQQKGAFDAIVAQYGFTKGDPTRGGQVSWQKGVKSWFCSPEVAQAFAQFNPMAA